MGKGVRNKMGKDKNWGTILAVNLGRDKKTGKIIRLTRPIATTAKSKAEAVRNMQPSLNKMKKRKGVTKVFAIKPIELRISKSEFIKRMNKRRK